MGKIKKWLITKLGGYTEQPIQENIVKNIPCDVVTLKACFRQDRLDPSNIELDYIRYELAKKLAAELIKKNLITIEKHKVYTIDRPYLDTIAKVSIVKDESMYNINNFERFY